MALSVRTIGAESRSASCSTSSRPSRAPCPTSRVTFFAWLSSEAACCTTSGAGMLRGRVSMNLGTSVPLGSSSPPTSPGRVSTATPEAWIAALPACSMSSGSWSIVVTVSLNTATSANRASLSTSWKNSLPISSRGTWPQIARTGACDFLASYRPLSRWTAPGPTVPMHTASPSLSWAWALAAKAPTSSCLTPIHSIRSSRRIASVTGFSASPTTPHTVLIP